MMLSPSKTMMNKILQYYIIHGYSKMKALACLNSWSASLKKKPTPILKHRDITSRHRFFLFQLALEVESSDVLGTSLGVSISHSPGDRFVCTNKAASGRVLRCLSLRVGLCFACLAASKADSSPVSSCFKEVCGTLDDLHFFLLLSKAWLHWSFELDIVIQKDLLASRP